MRIFYLYMKMLRVKQWIKNILIFFPLLIFPSEINLKASYALILIFGLFCCASSLVYIINDWVDRKSDALNKNKKNRPFANKDLNFKDAALGTFFLFTIFLILFSQTYQISPGVCLLVVIYLIQGFLYSFYLKNISLIEMLLVSTGYSYRAFAGGLGIYLLPS